MMSQYDFYCDVKGSVRSFYSTLLSHTAERYLTLPVYGRKLLYLQVFYNEQGRPSIYNQVPVHVHSYHMVPMKLLNDDSQVSNY